MAVEQLPDQVREFASYLSGLMKRLDQGGGWCGVFWQRDPDGMRACLDGWEVPPWDVVEALLHDLAAEYGARAAAQEAQRARSLHGASLAAYDARPGGRDTLGDRLDVMLREQRYTAERQAELNRQLHAAGTREEADAVRLDLAWAHDDHERATARCTELRLRMENLDRRALRTHAPGALDFSGGAGGGVLRVEDGEGDGARGAGREPGDHRALEGEPAVSEAPGAPGAGTRHRPTIPEQTGPRSPFADPTAPAASNHSVTAPEAPHTPATAPEAPHDPATARPGAYGRATAPAPRRESAPGHPGSYDQAASRPGPYDQTAGGSGPRSGAAAYVPGRPGSGGDAFTPTRPGSGRDAYHPSARPGDPDAGPEGFDGLQPPIPRPHPHPQSQLPPLSPSNAPSVAPAAAPVSPG